MILRCSHCRTRFAADDAHRGRTFRCRVCQSPIRAEGEAEAAGGGGSKAKSKTPAAFAPTMIASSPPPAYAAKGSTPPAASSAPPRSSNAPRSSAAPAAQAETRASAPASIRPAATAAVVRRNDERSKRDLFGGEVELAAKVVERNESPFTAARNENSVLFSLDQLSKPAPVAARSGAVRDVSAASSGSGVSEERKDDSGIIDLNKLMDVQLSAKSVRPPPISEAPLGYALEVSTPLPMVADPTFGAQGKKNKTGLIAGLAVAAALALVGIGVATTHAEDARLKAAAAAAAAPPPAPPPPVATPDPTPAPAPIVATPPNDTAEKDTKAHAKSGGKVGGKKPGAGAKSAGASSPAPAAPKKAADPCGCHGDLMCNMRCSSK